MAGVDNRNETTVTETATATTLLVRHLPEGIPEATLSRLFSHYGASSVRSFTSNHNNTKLRNCAFLDFDNQPTALQAQRHLNGLRFLGRVLKVERAINTQQPTKTTKTQQDESLKGQSGGTHQTQLSFSDDVIFAAEYIAPRLGVDYPYPPHLEYTYPPPDGNILTNIVNSLIAVPRFYTQVLHLMNKMNIPAPFRMALPTPPLPPPPPPPPPPTESTKQPLTELSSEESEIESSDEEFDASRRSKCVKRDTIVGPAVDKDVSHEAVGVKAATLLPKEIPVIKKRNPVLQIKIASKAARKEHNDDDDGDRFVREKVESKTESIDIIQPYATPEEIQNGKLGPEELLSLPVFKNYKVGTPACVLYIKNLAKDVVNDDFYYIFGSLFGSIDLAKSGVSVKLMQEGRMRGQAFVTFPSVELAHQALNLVNGFEFKGKPMVIQFGRNPAVSKEK